MNQSVSEYPNKYPNGDWPDFSRCAATTVCGPGTPSRQCKYSNGHGINDSYCMRHKSTIIEMIAAEEVKKTCPHCGHPL